jgi:hypothetical protein
VEEFLALNFKDEICCAPIRSKILYCEHCHVMFILRPHTECNLYGDQSSEMQNRASWTGDQPVTKLVPSYSNKEKFKQTQIP